MSRGAAAALRGGAATAASALVGHPRHAALFALAGGLLLARAPLAAVVGLAVAAAALVLAAGRLLAATLRPEAGGLAPAVLAGAVPGAGVAIAVAVAALAWGFVLELTSPIPATVPMLAGLAVTWPGWWRGT